MRYNHAIQDYCDWGDHDDSPEEPHVPYKADRQTIHLQNLGHALREAAFICRDWHSGQSSACYKIQCGEFYHLEAHDLERAARELRSHMGKPELPDDDAADLAAAANALDRCAAEWEGVYGLL